MRSGRIGRHSDRSWGESRHSARFSSTLLTHSNEAELEFQSERSYRAVKEKTPAPDTIRTCDLCLRRGGAAAADMPAHLREDLSASRVRIPLQQIGRAHDLSGLAIAALRHPLGQPRFLHRMQGVRRKALDRRYLLAVSIRHLRLARKRALAVDMHHAGAAE